MGTTEGELYIWEIVTGEKVGVFPELQGSYPNSDSCSFITQKKDLSWSIM
jgi:hypothetical protein